MFSHPWRISCMCDREVTGLMPRQKSRDPNSGGEGPVDHSSMTFARAGAPSMVEY